MKTVIENLRDDIARLTVLRISAERVGLSTMLDAIDADLEECRAALEREESGPGPVAA